MLAIVHTQTMEGNDQDRSETDSPDRLRHELDRMGQFLNLVLETGRMNGAYVGPDLRHTWVHNDDPEPTTEEILGRTDAELFPERAAEPTMAIKRDAIDAEGRVEREFSFAKPDEIRRYRAAAEPLYGEEGEVEGAMFAAVDVSDRYRLLDRTTDAVYTVDEDWEITFWNDRMAERTGVPGEEVVGSTVWDAFGDSIPAELEDRYRRAMRTGEPMEFTQYIGGSFDYWVEVRAFPDANGLSIYSRDVTERRRREQDLERQQYLFRRVQQMADIGVWEFDTASDELTWSEGIHAIHGVDEAYEPSVEEGIDFYHPDDRDTIGTAFDRALETGEWYDHRLRIVRPSGEVRHVRVNGEVTERSDDDGKLIRGTMQDITGRVEHERTLRQLQARTKRLISTTDPKEAADIAVEAAQDIVGSRLAGVYLASNGDRSLQPEAVLDTVDEEFETVRAYDRDAVDDPIADLAWSVYEREGTVAIDDLHERDGLNDQTPARSAIVTPLGDHGVYIISSTEPNAFTERQQTLVDVFGSTLATALDRIQVNSELERQNKRLEEFAGVVSHDLRNPLASAIGWLDVARSDPRNADDAFDRVETAHERMESLIDDVLALAKAGGSDPDRTTVSLASAMADAWGTVDTRDAALVTRTTATVHAEPSRLQQALENLLRNAVEHGSADVTVTVGDTPDGFYVEDDGPGIPPDDRDQIFEWGYSTGEDGTGYGLSIVAEVADAHGWNVRVTESGDGGARFEFCDGRTED